MNISMFEVLSGSNMSTYLCSPWLRWHHQFENYPDFLSDIDDHAFMITDDFERFKKYRPLKKHIVGTSPIIPREDSDQTIEWFDINGENMFSHPPNPNYITIDHGVDEEHIWAFGKTLHNVEAVKNQYVSAGGQLNVQSFAPFWGHKLSMPAWYRKDKMEKFYRHWNHRLGLESLKISHAIKYGAYPTKQ